MLDDRELVLELRTGKSRPGIARAPILSSAKLPWQGILLEHHEVQPFENDDVSCLNNVIVLQRSAPITVEWKREGQYRPLRFQPGQITILPAEMPHSARSQDHEGSFLTLSVQQRLLAYATCDFTDLDRLELAPVLGTNDPLIEGICLTFQKEAAEGAPNGRLYTDSLTTALALHLVQKYAASQPRPREYRGGLQKHQLRSALDFINANLEKDISLASISTVVGISPYHFARLFKQSTGLAPHQYLLRSRVERARQMLLRSQGEIAEIAVGVGFCDQSHFTRHFKRVIGVTPKKFVREMGVRKPSA
jgi:AraC family transcriptional regulator